MKLPTARATRTRRSLLKGASLFAFASWLPARAAEESIPDIPELTQFLAGRRLRFERVRLELPQLADNGQAVPMKLAVAGPFAPGAEVRSIHLFSEKNPVPLIAQFDFPETLARVELESRVRLAGTQHLVSVASLGDGTLLAAST